jgi:hypothetical protein
MVEELLCHEYEKIVLLQRKQQQPCLAFEYQHFILIQMMHYTEIYE